MQRATDKILISLKRSNSNSIVSKSPRNRILVLGEKFALEEAVERVRTRAGSDVPLPLGKQTAWKKVEKKKTARFLLVPRNAQKSYNVRIRRKIS